MHLHYNTMGDPFVSFGEANRGDRDNLDFPSPPAGKTSRRVEKLSKAGGKQDVKKTPAGKASRRAEKALKSGRKARQ